MDALIRMDISDVLREKTGALPFSQEKIAASAARFF